MRKPIFQDLALWFSLNEIRAAVNGGFALGNDRFKAQIAEILKRRVERGTPGRPSKEKSALSETAMLPG